MQRAADAPSVDVMHIDTESVGACQLSAKRDAKHGGVS